MTDTPIAVSSPLPSPWRVRWRASGRRLFGRFATLYARLFAAPRLRPVNDALLTLALRARGYGNCCDAELTGEAAFVRLLASYSPKLCIDVGANRGHYSEALLRATGARVVAFEPLPSAYSALASLAARHQGRLIPVNSGVGDMSGELDLRYSEENSEVASFADEIHAIDYVRATNTRSMRVPVVTLDEYFDGEARALLGEGIDLLKIDTEGYEHNVLRGARRLIESVRPRFVQVEFNWHQLFRGQSLYSLAQCLPDHRVYQLLPYRHGLRRVDPRRPESNIFEFANFVFVRADIVLR